MIWRVSLMGLMLCDTVCADSVQGEWILRRESSVSWDSTRGRLNAHFKWLRFFGPEKQFALVRQRSFPLKKFLLPKGVEIQPNYVYRAFDQKNPELDKSWGLQNIGKNPGVGQEGIPGVDVNAIEAWKAQGTGIGAMVAVLDSGVDTAHEDLQKNVVKGWNFINDTSDVRDDNGHGTRVAGVIAADADNGRGSRGVSNGPLLIVKMLDDQGHGTTESVVRGLQYALEKGAKIVNMSWGGSAYDPVFYEMVKGAKQTLFITASGNTADDIDVKESAVYPSSFRLVNVLSVSAYDNRDRLASFSNFGKETVHLGAPGMGIYSTKPGGYGFSDGTSYAAPFVAGTAALVWGALPSLSVESIKKRLLKTSEPIGYYEKEFLASGGRVNAYNALVNFEPVRPKSPTTWVTHKTALGTPHPYLNNFKDTYYVTSPGATHLRVHFSRFQLESKYDHLTIRDGKGRFVQRYTGDLGAFTSADVLGDSLTLEFKADNNSPDWGFEIDAFEVPIDFR